MDKEDLKTRLSLRVFMHIPHETSIIARPILIAIYRTLFAFCAYRTPAVVFL